MKIYVGADHAGFGLKEKLKPYIAELGHEVEDKGAYEYTETDDYPDFMIPVAEEISKSSGEARGILFGGSGQGEAMIANRFHGVRAAVYYGKSKCVAGEGEDSIIKLSREHNDSNILSLGARFITEDEAKAAVKEWLATPFTGEERHKRRLAKIEKLGKQ